MRFAMKKSRGLGWGVLLGLLFFIPVLVGPELGLPDPKDNTFKLMLIVPMYFLLVMYVYTLLALLTTKYWLDDQAFHIRWGFRHKIIPLTAITDVIDYQGNPNLGVMVGYSWPGHIIGYYNIHGLGIAEFFGADWKDGMIIVKYDGGSVAITPTEKNVLLNTLAAAANKTIQNINADDPSVIKQDDELFEETIDRIDQDKGYQALIKVNLGLIAVLIAFLAIFFPGSGAVSMILVFPGLAISMFVFILAIASRMYQMMPTMAYAMFLLSMMVTLVFIIISILVVAFY